MMHVVLAKFLKEHAGLFKLLFVLQTLFKVTFFGKAGAIVLLKHACDVVNFSPGWGFRKPGHFNVRDQAARREVDIDLQALITHNALLLTKKPVKEFWSKKETILCCDLVSCGYNLEMKAVNRFDYEVSDLLVV